MFGLLNTTQIYGLQHEQHITPATPATPPATTPTTTTTNAANSSGRGDNSANLKQHRRSTSNVTETLKEKRFFATFSSSMPQSIKSPTNFIEKFLKSELLNGYDTLKNYKNTQQANAHTNGNQQHHYNSNIQANIVEQQQQQQQQHNQYHQHRDSLSAYNCLHGSYRSNCDGEFYEAINLNTPTTTAATAATKTAPITTATTTTRTRTNSKGNCNNNNKKSHSASEMTIKCSKNLLVEATQPQSPATLQNYQKLPDFAHDLMIDVPSGASSGEFNQQQQQQQQQQLHNQHHHHSQQQQHHHHHHHHSHHQHQSSGSETNGLSSAASNLYKKLSFGSRSSKQHLDISGTNSAATTTTSATQALSNEVASDNSCSSISTTTTTRTSASASSASTPRASHNSHSGSNSSKAIERTSSSSSSADCGIGSKAATKAGVLKNKERRKATTELNENDGGGGEGQSASASTPTLTPERAQRRRLLQTISNYDHQNKQLQRELAKEKRRRTEELACVVKSLLCFESKLKTDMKAVNQRMLEKDNEICRLVRQNRALRKRLAQQQRAERDSARDEGVVEDGGVDEEEETEADPAQKQRAHVADNEPETLSSDNELLAIDCLVLEALQCMNCRKQFYDIDLKECWTQTKECSAASTAGRKKDEHAIEPWCSSSDDTTVSSSFYGARRSVRYTSKRTAGTFRDYMRSRSMNIDDPALEQNSEENTSTISREDESQTTSSYEKINMYSRTIERMHGVKCDAEERVVAARQCREPAAKCAPQIEEDDGIFSPTQDDDDDEQSDAALHNDGSLKIVLRRSIEFSEAAPKQLYETSTDDWYASASDQEDLVAGSSSSCSKPYGHGAVNPVLECVNQILLQESMDEVMHEPELPPTLQQKQKQHQHLSPQQQQQLTPKTSAHLLQVPVAAGAASNLPRRSSLSDRRTPRHSNSNHGNSNNNNSSQSNGDATHSRYGTLTRKRVHFSTKNSMVHVPRNDDDDDDDDVDDDDEADANANANAIGGGNSTLISSQSSLYYPMNYCPPSPQQVAERERLEVLNYESIYSNEYEPIGSEHNSSNLYVDMEAATKMSAAAAGGATAAASATATTGGAANGNLASSSAKGECKLAKLPPALPPKPANLIKFRKSLQQLDEVPETEHMLPGAADCGDSTLSGGGSEPDYCSISEVNVGMTSVQIVADVHKAPSGAHDGSEEGLELEALEVSTVASSGDEDAVTHKTDRHERANSDDDNQDDDDDEEEELLADIPKLPNVAAIIVPKSPKKQQQQQQQQQQPSDYLTMTPKVPPPNLKLLTPLITPPLKKAPATVPTPLKLQLNVTPGSAAGGIGGGVGGQQPYKRKHMPNILAEINKRMSQPNSPTTPTRPTNPAAKTPTTPTHAKTTNTAVSGSGSGSSSAQTLLKELEQSANTSPSLPLEAEFDWYNLDAEYGKVPAATSAGVVSVSGVGSAVNGPKMLAEIHEDHESIDEYNLDEEFSLASSEKDEHSEEEPMKKGKMSLPVMSTVGLPLYGESSPMVPTIQPAMMPVPTITATMPIGTLQNTKAKKMKKNLANFEKFIEGSGLSTKPLPSRRKIYFAGPV